MVGADRFSTAPGLIAELPSRGVLSIERHNGWQKIEELLTGKTRESLSIEQKLNINPLNCTMLYQPTIFEQISVIHIRKAATKTHGGKGLLVSMRTNEEKNFSKRRDQRLIQNDSKRCSSESY